MKTYLLPFDEHLKGFYEIEANSLEHAKEIARSPNFTETREPEYTSGSVDWNVDDIQISRPRLKLVK